jgi:hypothetical protein
MLKITLMNKNIRFAKVKKYENELNDNSNKNNSPKFYYICKLINKIHLS